MKQLRQNSSGFSMMEALVGAMIFAIGVLGVFATMSAQKVPSAQADKRVMAALTAKQFLEGLRSKVDAGTYDSGALSLGTHAPVSLGTYTINYYVNAVGRARKVDLNITW
jgi:Tfp pilus assembly protein PilV